MSMNERTFNRNKASKFLEGVEAGYVHPEAFLDFLEKECVLPDPRIARIEALCDQVDSWNASNADTWFVIPSQRLRALLAGGDA